MFGVFASLGAGFGILNLLMGCDLVRCEHLGRRCARQGTRQRTPHRAWTVWIRMFGAQVDGCRGRHGPEMPRDAPRD